MRNLLIILILCVSSCVKDNKNIETILFNDSVPLTTLDKEINTENNLRIYLMSEEEKDFINFLSYQLELNFMEIKWVNCFQPLSSSQKRVWAKYWAIMGWYSLTLETKNNFCDTYKILKQEGIEGETALKELLFVYVFLSYYININLDFCFDYGI